MTELKLILTCALLVGCSGMTREEVIAADKQCREAGLVTETVENMWNYNIWKINCLPKQRVVK